MIPRDVRFEKSHAERRVFEALRDALPGSYTVLHHVPWVHRRRSGGAYDGEADFVIVHPQRGVLVLEVKGGGIRYEASTSTWYTTPRRGSERRLHRDPFEQASDSKYKLRHWLRELPGWQRARESFGHAVCFPDAIMRGQQLPHVPPEIIVHGDDLADENRLRARVESIFDFWSDGTELGSDAAQKVVSSLAHDVVLRQPLGILVQEADREILSLSEQQYQTLLLLSRLPRVAISGPAGSGKTLLAVEKARRLAAQEGRKTLLTCFNRPLADYLKASLVGVDGLDVSDYHQLCHRLAREARLPLPPASTGGLQWDQLPSLLASATDRLASRYDAIVVDEAQDFDESWWLPLLMLLHEPDHGILYVFYDDNQAIYPRPRGLPDGLQEITLLESFRNTRPIFDSVMQFYEGDAITCRGPDGPEVTVQTVPARELPRELGRTLHRLVNEDGVSPGDIAVLTPRSVESSSVCGTIGNFTLTPEPRSRMDVLISTIHRFKGLDAPAVVICELAPARPDHRALMYVGCSRARVLLTVLLTE